MTFFVTDIFPITFKAKRRAMRKDLLFKTVVSSENGFFRGVFFEGRSCKQIAVLSSVQDSEKVKLSVPVEGMAGWSVKLNNFSQAYSVAQRELTRNGRFLNRVLFMPWFLLKGTLG